VRHAAIFDQTRPALTMPNANAQAVRAGAAALAKIGGQYCHGATCTFRLRGLVGGDTFALDMLVPRDMVDHGFFPQWVNDVAGFKEALGWESGAPAAPGQVAVYFENSGLPAGRYRTDQWIRVGSPAALASTCPAPVRAGGAVTFAGAAH
jgi:hypothetical protein